MGKARHEGTKARRHGVVVMAGVLVVAGAVAAQTTRPAAPPAPPAPAAPTAPAATQPASQPARGVFDPSASDPKAIEIADQVMERLGGRDRWSKTRHISWKFFAGERLWFWDRLTNRVRLEGKAPRTGKHYVVLMDLDTMEGQVWQDGLPIQESDVHDALEAAVKYWINDSYWLLMPYKLKDPGVTLKYLGVENLPDGRPADVIQLTFDHVGFTHQNKYDVFVGQDTKLVEYWRYYSDADDPTPYLEGPWSEWEQYGLIMLSPERGQLDDLHMRLDDIAVYDEIEEEVYASPMQMDWDMFRKRRGTGRKGEVVEKH